MTVHYQVDLCNPKAHEFLVSLWFECDKAQKITLSLPAWIPGSYMIRDFARNLLDLAATDQNGEQLGLKKQDKQTWQLDACIGINRLQYRVYAYDESVRSAYFDMTRAYFNGTSLFLQVDGYTDLEHRLTLSPPTYSCMQDWRVATTLPAVAVDKNGFGEYQCSDYDALIDYPVEIANWIESQFVSDEIEHRMVFSDAAGIDAQRIADDLLPICQEHAAMFGDLPIQRYLFMTLATADGYGGLEHRDSTSLVCKRSDLPYCSDQQPDQQIDKGYRTFLALCSHEYFHLWNVKRIRPQVFAEQSLQQEVHTELLWAFEGITSYYDELALPRAGVIDADQYLDMLAPAISRYQRNPGRFRQSVAESSFDAWTKFYKQDENALNAIVSYYNKGALIALGLDVLIRTRSEDSLCLDDLMRDLWQRYGRTQQGVPERAIEQCLERMLGQSVENFFQAYVYGTEPLPLPQWLAELGIGMGLRCPRDPSDQGGFIEKANAVAPAKANLQAVTEQRPGGLFIVRVTRDGAAEKAGLGVGDQLVAIDDEQVTAANLDQLLRRKPLGAQVTVSYFHRHLLRHTTLELQAGPEDTCDLYWLDSHQLTTEIRQRKNHWLASVRG